MCRIIFLSIAKLVNWYTTCFCKLLKPYVVILSLLLHYTLLLSSYTRSSYLCVIILYQWVCSVDSIRIEICYVVIYYSTILKAKSRVTCSSIHMLSCRCRYLSRCLERYTCVCTFLTTFNLISVYSEYIAINLIVYIHCMLILSSSCLYLIECRLKAHYVLI